MISDYRCFFCINRTFESLLNKYPLSNGVKSDFTREMALQFARQQKVFSMPLLARDLHAHFRLISNDIDPFRDAKMWSNNIVSGMLEEWSEKVTQASNPFNMAMRLAIAGNLIDYATGESFDLKATLERVVESTFAIDDSAKLQEKVASAKKILYLGDNAGEIVFDKLFIETMKHPNLTFVVRGGPVINDATVDDARKVGMGQVARVITNGYDAPSTLLDRCSKEFLDEYNSADLVISKGQGNLEGLLGSAQREVFFLLMAKCNVIADILGVKKGDFIVKQYTPSGMEK